MGVETLVIASVAMAAIGTGLQVYSAQQAAANERRMADYNAEIARQQAAMQGAIAQRQAQIAQYNAQLQMRQAESQQQASEIQAQMMEYNANLQAQNATTMRAYAANNEATGREQARRLREEKMRILGTQRSQYAAAGVTMDGSPLAVLAETDGLLELNIQDAWYQTTTESGKMRAEADMQDADASLTRWKASATRSAGAYDSLLSQGAAQADYDSALWEESTAAAGARIGARQAEIDRLAGRNRAQAYDIQGVAAGVSGAADISSTLLSYNYNRPRTGGASTPAARA